MPSNAGTLRQSRAGKSNPCKICGENNQWCLHLDNGGMLCMKHELQGSQYHAKTQGYYYAPDYFDPLGVRIRIDVIPKTRTVINELASIERRNEIYHLLLEMMPRSEEHQRHLLDVRRLPVQTLASFGTLWTEEEYRQDVAQTLNASFSLKGIPGFYERFMSVWSIAGPGGLMIPCKNRDGLIQGFQIRRDNVDKGKYVWFSSNPEARQNGTIRYHNGTASGTFLHYAGSKKPVDLFITEGALKAEIAHYLSGETFVGLPGLNPGETETFLSLFDYWTLPANLIFCPDADFRINKHVYKAWVRNIQEIGTVYPRIRVACWEPESGKGIDEFLINTGHMPFIYSARRWYERFRVPEFEQEGKTA
jgi:DNA primase